MLDIYVHDWNSTMIKKYNQFNVLYSYLFPSYSSYFIYNINPCSVDVH